MATPLFIGITGGSGSGKTCFIRDLRARFSKDQLCIVSQDDYYHPREQQIYDAEGVQNFDLPDSIDHHAFADDLNKLAEGKSIKRKEYVFNNEKATPTTLTIDPAPVILVEGLFVFHVPHLNEKLDIKIFMHADDVRKLKRRILRDQHERNYPIDDVLYRYEAHVLPAYRKYIEPYKEDADLVINNNRSYDVGLEIITSYITSKVTKETE